MLSETYIKKHSHRKYDSTVRTSAQIQELPPIEKQISPPMTDIEIFKNAMLRDAKSLDRRSQEVWKFIANQNNHVN